MITIKNKDIIEKMTIAGNLLAQMFNNINNILDSGVSKLEIDKWIDNYLKSNNLVSSSRGYMGYKHVSCISVNQEVVHGIPNNYKLSDGDLVKIDVCASYKSGCADMARCFFIGEAPTQAKNLVKVAMSALDKGIEKARPLNRIGDISYAIQVEVEKNGYSVVREFAGHGIGKKMHEDPEILNYGKPGCGPIISQSMAFAIEPIINMGDHRVVILKDGWTVKTADNSLSAHVEDTVIITDGEPKIITRL